MGRHWDRWARRQGVSCYRVYDRDIPEVPISIDRYEDRLYIVEHARPHARSPLEQRGWFEQMAAVAAEVLAVEPQRVFVHAREREPVGRGPTGPIVVQEAGLAFEVHLDGRGDTGLPLDQRGLRALLAAQAAGKRFLNLFGRGAAATVFAARAGATASLTLEPSKPAARWSRGNLDRNQASPSEHVVNEAEPLEWLERMRRQQAEPFDLALVAPPAGFHRRADSDAWNPREAYRQLIDGTGALLCPGGKLYFVSSVRRFRLDPQDFPAFSVRDVSGQTLPPDFRARPPHRAWSLIVKPS